MRDIIGKLKQLGWHVGTMESCTGGLIASKITDTEGASSILTGTRVTYSNEEKALAGVDVNVINNYGVYSPQVASEMAVAIANHYTNNIGIGVTGTLGNIDTANRDSVPGIVYFAIAIRADSRLIDRDTIAYSGNIIVDVRKYTTRKEQKEYVANVILKSLKEVIRLI